MKYFWLISGILWFVVGIVDIFTKAPQCEINYSLIWAFGSGIMGFVARANDKLDEINKKLNK